VVTDHDAAPQSGPELPLFIFSIFFFVWIFLARWGKMCMVKCRLMSPWEEPEVNEKLGTYFECVPAFARKCQLAQELYSRNKLNIKTIEDGNLDNLRTEIGKKKIITGPSTYNMQDDQRYLASFSYVPVELRDLPEEEDISDPITQMLFMGFLRKDTNPFKTNMKALMGASRQKN